MKKTYKAFISSIKAQLSADALSLNKFITEETYIKGKPFSFKGHEYQEYFVKLLEDNPGCTFSVMKPSQIGMSEVMYRVILARMAMVPGCGVALSMPSLIFSQEVFKTRLSMIIRSSPILSGLIDSNNDSASVKAFHNESLVYGLSGAEGSKSLINRPISWVVVDECDRQSRKQYTGYRSRQGHSDEDDCTDIYISTPTVQGFGVDREVSECGIIHEPWVVCGCGHEFLPDFYENVVIPGYSQPLRLLNRSAIAQLDVDGAYLECPSCKKDVDKGNRQTKWVVTVNEKYPSNYIGVKLNPWVAHSFLTIPKLIRSSVTFESNTEWLNQGLGLTARLSDSSINREVFTFNNKPEPIGIDIFGLDMGKVCTYMRGKQLPDTTTRICDAKLVKVGDLDKFLEEENKKHMFAAGVMDAGPLVEMVYKLVQKYERLYSCSYLRPRKPMPELYKIKQTDKHDELVRLVELNHTLAFDTFFTMLKDLVEFQSGDLDESIVKHFLTLRRVRDYARDSGDLMYKWVKTSAEDHFAHAYIYLMVARKLALAGIASGYSVPFCIKSLKHG